MASWTLSPEGDTPTQEAQADRLGHLEDMVIALGNENAFLRETLLESLPDRGQGYYGELGPLRGEVIDLAPTGQARIGESALDLERGMAEGGWLPMVAGIAQEFTPVGRRMIVDACRTMAISHPLLKRGLNVRIGYIWGQGVQVTARVMGAGGATDNALQKLANQAIDDFEKLNESTFTSMKARQEKERALGTDGEIFIALFTDPAAGKVRVRTVPQLEILQIITNPEDRHEPWFFLREWSVQEMPEKGEAIGRTTTRRVIYPALGFDPAKAGLGYKPSSINGVKVHWDAPMLQMAVNRLDGWQRGIPDVYAGLAWARLYRDFMIDWAGLTRALSRVAWQASGDNRSRAAAAAQQALAARTPSARQSALEGAAGASSAGGTIINGPGNTFEAVNKTGATIDAGSGRPLACMIAASLGVPVTILLADPGVTGARATAQTLDLPTILEMGMRRLEWQSALEQIYQYALDVATHAPGSALRGLKEDPVLEWAWPALDGVNALETVQAIVAADTTDKLPGLTTARLLLNALGVPNVDEILASMTDEQGNFVPPNPPTGGAGDVATAAHRRGEDPASAAAYGSWDAQDMTGNAGQIARVTAGESATESDSITATDVPDTGDASPADDAEEQARKKAKKKATPPDEQNIDVPGAEAPGDGIDSLATYGAAVGENANDASSEQSATPDAE